MNADPKLNGYNQNGYHNHYVNKNFTSIGYDN
jgi:hypothetical protein